MSFAYNKGAFEIASGNVALATADMRVLLVMSNTTADTERSVNFLNGFTTLDEYDGANYARVDLASVALNRDDPNNRSEADADDAVFTNLGAGTRQAVGAIYYVHVTDDTDSFPIAYIDTGGFPFDGTGSNNTVQWNAEGIFQVGSAT